MLFRSDRAGVMLEIEATGFIGGANMRAVSADFWVTTAASVMTITEMRYAQYVNNTGELAVSVVSVSANVATVAVSWTHSGVENASVHANIRGRSGSAFKIRRL